MPSPSSPSSWRSAALLASLISSTYAVGFDCSQILDDGVHWNLNALAGTHTAQYELEQSPMIANWTFAVDLCHTIPKDKEIDDKDQCPQGTNVCGIMREHPAEKVDDTVRKVVPISGAFSMKTGIHQDVKPTRLKHSASSADSEKEGVRLEMNGGRYPFDQSDSTKQKAIIELVCNREMTGWEPVKAPDSKSKRNDEDDKDKKDEEKNKNALRIISYKDEIVDGTVWGVVRMEWLTKEACEDAVSKPGSGDGTSGGWGFFTWLIVIIFMAVAAYVIMGAWFNYTKHGSRGLDLLPHSDTIRDIPYIIKDMLRRLSGGSSRGGYSAV